MQRRLTIALVATALVSIVLVGFGVLAMAQLSARSNTEDRVARGLNVVSGFLVDSERPRRQVETLVSGSRTDFGLDLLEAVTVDPDGSVQTLRNARRTTTSGTAIAISDFPNIALGEDQQASLARGETVLVADGNLVIGLRTVEVNELAGDADPNVTIMAGGQVTAVARQTVAWFLLSSALVIAGAILAGLLLAARLARPIRNIQAATTSIAGGNLEARVNPSGSDEVADLGHAVNQMAADLQRSKALDRQFLMSVSHDLRTPLTAIAGYAEGLQDGAVTNPAAAGEVIGNHAHRLDVLVGDLLDLARLDANRFRLDIRRFDLTVLTGRTVAGLSKQAEQHGLTLTASGPLSLLVEADPDRTAQAIGNLIDNAVKFARTRILVQLTDDGGGWAVVSVHDDGPGIPDPDIPHIFDRLYTGKAQPDRAENPTGLGLAIVRELVHAMGGSVRASNNATGGACISLRLPLDSAVEGRELPASTAGSLPPGDRTAASTDEAVPLIRGQAAPPSQPVLLPPEPDLEPQPPA